MGPLKETLLLRNGRDAPKAEPISSWNSGH